MHHTEEVSIENRPIVSGTTPNFDISEKATGAFVHKKRANSNELKKLVGEVRTVRSDVQSARRSFRKVEMYLKSMVGVKLGVKDEGSVQLLFEWDVLSLEFDRIIAMSRDQAYRSKIIIEDFCMSLEEIGSLPDMPVKESKDEIVRELRSYSETLNSFHDRVEYKSGNLAALNDLSSKVDEFRENLIKKYPEILRNSRLRQANYLQEVRRLQVELSEASARLKAMAINLCAAGSATSLLVALALLTNVPIGDVLNKSISLVGKFSSEFMDRFIEYDKTRAHLKYRKKVLKEEINVAILCENSKVLLFPEFENITTRIWALAKVWESIGANASALRSMVENPRAQTFEYDEFIAYVKELRKLYGCMAEALSLYSEELSDYRIEESKPMRKWWQGNRKK